MPHRKQHTLARIRVMRQILQPRRPMWRKRRLPRQAQPDGVRVTYWKRIRELLLDKARRLVEERLLPRLPEILRRAKILYGDRQDADINDLMDELSKKFFDELKPSELERAARAVASATADFHKEQLNKQVRAAVGVDVLRAEPSLEGRVGAFVSENVARIKSVPNAYFDEIEKRVTRAVREGATSDQLATSLQEAYEMSDRQAKLIARDQIGKFYGEVNEARQQALGVTHYIWRTSNDERVRPEHADREGKRYAWEDPPEDGHPGEPINCRCYPEPDMSEILEAL